MPILRTRRSSTNAPAGIGGELPREGHADEDVDAGAFDQLDFLLQERDQGRAVVLLQQAQGVRLERHGDRGAVDRICFFNHLVKQGLVADVDAVEIADRDHRAFKRLSYLFQLVDEQHTNPFPKRTIRLTCLPKTNK